MDHQEMQIQTSHPDPSAYLELSNQYSWKLYAHLESSVQNRQLLKELYEKAMACFCESVNEWDDSEQLEGKLYEAADRVCEANPHLTEHQLEPQAGKGSGLGFWVAFLLLLVLNLVCIWIILGIMMDIGWIPEMDLGYSWFQSNILSRFGY